MKKLTIIVALLSLILSACQSNEDKAAALIKKELSKTLYDFESYEPIETTVTRAYNTAYNDSACVVNALAIWYKMQELYEEMNAAKEASEHMDIWGAPTYYSSTYSDNQYYKYKRERDEKISDVKIGFMLLQSAATELQDSVLYCDGKKEIGWEARHRFRCKTRGGDPIIADFRYVFTDDFKNIILHEDLDNDDLKNARKIIEKAIAGNLVDDFKIFN